MCLIDQKFKVGDLVAFRKKKRCKKKGKFWAKYVGPYSISKFDEVRHKFCLMPLRPETEAITYIVLHFDFISCELEVDLTNINTQG